VDNSIRVAADPEDVENTKKIDYDTFFVVPVILVMLDEFNIAAVMGGPHEHQDTAGR
jgi:hypothetical protein